MLTAERLRDVLSYDRASGVMRWKNPTSRRVGVGSLAGSKRVDGFRKIVIDGKSYLAHRLAVLHVTGKMPTNDVAFRNGRREDTRWRNLRTA
jgi:hypothetical protein